MDTNKYRGFLLCTVGEHFRESGLKHLVPTLQLKNFEVMFLFYLFLFLTDIPDNIVQFT